MNFKLNFKVENYRFVCPECDTPSSKIIEGNESPIHKIRLKDRINIAVLEGDLETERDAIRIRQHGVQALQIVTHGTCHFEAQMIQQVLPKMNFENMDILFIENVGNLVCPASYDLGEDIRVTLVSCTEGDAPK